MMSPKALLAIFVLLLLFFVRSSAGCFESERLALLKFKQSLVDHTGLLSSWNETEDCCKWKRIACDNTGHVVKLVLVKSYAFLKETRFVFLKGNMMSPSLLELSHLNYLDLTGIDFGGARLPEFIGSLDKLTTLNLNMCNLSGGIPFQLGNLSRLETLYLGYNHFYGIESLEWISHLSSLKLLELSRTNLSKANWQNVIAKLPTLELLILSECSLEVPKWASSFYFNSSTSLRRLDLSYNSLTSSIYPWLLNFSRNLEVLSLDSNKLQGPIPHTLGNLTSLEFLSLRNNRLEGGITQEHLSNLSRLKVLDLSGNSLSFKLRLDWVPPFLLEYLLLSSCKLGPNFPRWLHTQSSLVELDISNNSITGHVPNWIWDISSKMKMLNISYNHLNGMLPNRTSDFGYDTIFDLSGNNFEGPIPQFPSNASFLRLSDNSFTGSMSVLCAITGEKLKFLDLSNNVLSGKLPDCWKQFPELLFLNVANNHLFGNIPKTIGSLRKMESLSFYNNNFSGVLPVNLKNCVALRKMNLGKNRITGEIPIWIGENLLKLIVLSLRSNSFYGSIPSQLCHLQRLRVLDLSLNNISGTIPKCIKNFKAMAQNESAINESSDIEYVFQYQLYRGIYSDNIVLAINGAEHDYQSILRFVFAIDLSGNQLIGDIPVEITNLVGLVALNLSHNGLSGSIPGNVGHLKKLLSLDLSKNMLKGEIPTSLATISSLNHFNISFNNLSGKIPISTQLQSMNASAYTGNHELYGLPLDECNSLTEDDGNTQVPESGGAFFTLWFYVPMELGYMTGLLGLFIILHFNDSWRYSYCCVLNVLVKKIYG